MKHGNYGWFLVGLIWTLQLQAQTAIEDIAPTLKVEGGDVATQTVEIELLADQEIKPAVRELPQLVERIQVERLASSSPYVLLPHKPNYVLPVTYQSHPSDQEVEDMFETITGTSGNRNGNYEHVEAVFQLSVKYPLAEGWLGKMSRIDVAYTNRSFWQSYNGAISRPFRETNHEPEIIFSWQTSHNWIDYFALSLNHQSNGQTSTLSRSWNRVIADVASVYPIGILRTRVWWRIPEDKSEGPFDPSGDDNPDIEHYMGPGELSFIFAHGRNTITIMGRNNFDFDRNKGAIEIGWGFPLTKRVKGYVHYFNGYGESLIDYDRLQQRIGFGVKLSDWM